MSMSSSSAGGPTPEQVGGGTAAVSAALTGLCGLFLAIRRAGLRNA